MTDLSLLPPDTGVMLCGHGSRNQLAVGEFAVLADALKMVLEDRIFVSGNKTIIFA